MSYEDLAKKISDRTRLGLDDALAAKLKIPAEDAARGRLVAVTDGKKGVLGVYLLAVYVVDDTDLFGDGEIYWWSIPTLVLKNGDVTWSPVWGLPQGAEPHKVGSLEWMSNISLKDPPLLALIPPDDDVAACVVRLGIYDDDGAAADMRKALGEGLEALASCKQEGLKGAEQVITPVRDAIYKALRAQQDDILIDEDLRIRRGDATHYDVGLLGSVLNSRVRVYYFVKDELRTQTAGPYLLHKGQTETIKFEEVERGGKLAIFSRGADVECGTFGDLSQDMPFLTRVLDGHGVEQMKNGFQVRGTGPAKVVAYYTPPTIR